MASLTILFLCDEFSLLPIEIQNEEIGNLITQADGIRISQICGDTAQEFRIKIFERGLSYLPDESEYKRKFFENRIVPSLTENFRDWSIDTQERLLNKLYDVTNERMVRRSGMDDRRFRCRSYSTLLGRIPAGFEHDMVKFARNNIEQDEDRSDEDLIPSEGNQINKNKIDDQNHIALV